MLIATKSAIEIRAFLVKFLSGRFVILVNVKILANATGCERVNSAGAIAREGVNNGDVWRKERTRERGRRREYPERRIIAAEKKNGVYERGRTRICDATGACFATCVSYQLSPQRDRREPGGLSAPHTKSRAVVRSRDAMHFRGRAARRHSLLARFT